MGYWDWFADRMNHFLQPISTIHDLIGGIGALMVGFLIKRFGRKILGIATLVFGAFMIPSLIQGNVLSIASILLLIIVGITLLVQPVQKHQSPTTG
jgi:hypothetical protein